MDWTNLLGILFILVLVACGIFSAGDDIAKIFPRVKMVTIVALFSATTIFGLILALVPGLLTF